MEEEMFRNSKNTYATAGAFLTFFFSPSSVSPSKLARNVNGVFDRDRRVSRLRSSSILFYLCLEKSLFD